MFPTIPEVLADALTRRWSVGTPRTMRLAGLTGKVDAVVGSRRVGKSWLLQHHAREVEAGGVHRGRILYLNFEDERLVGLQAAHLGEVIDEWSRRVPGLLERERWLLLDEIQVVPGWERFVRRLVEDRQTHLVVTGSSARMLSREIATSLRGRALTHELFPFSFAEALRHAGTPVPVSWPVAAADRATLRAAFDHYFEVGGYPEVQGLDGELRRRILRDYADVALLRDVIERHGVGNVAGLRALHRRLLASPGTLFSVHRFANDLRSQGITVGKESLHEWIDHFSDACFAHFVPIHSASETVRRANARKFYPVDHAYVPRTLGAAPAFETLVFLALRRHTAEIAWVRNADGTEVDFAATDEEGRVKLVQACVTTGSGDTRAREVHALTRAMETLGLGEGTIVTLADREEIATAAGRIEVVPAWEWLLRPSAP